MSDDKLPTQKTTLPIDLYAVALALVLAALVRLNLIPPIKW
jgi:hypothetical protein